MNKIQAAYLKLHIAVLLAGLTAILGDLIELSAIVLVWWRVGITAISMLFFIRFGRSLKAIPRKLILQYMGIGGLIALHWITFFGAIKYSNASITLICMATTSFFTAFIEPLITKRPIKTYEIALSLLVIPGMILIVNSTALTMKLGIWIGLLSALLASLFVILNKILIHKADPMTITFLELGSGCLMISLILPFYFWNTTTAVFWPTGTDLIYLLILALLCTTLANVLGLSALKHIPAFVSNLAYNLEPVYGIILAWLVLNENKELSPGFYWGCLIIILAVFSYPILRRRFETHQE
jgi:drug/metabolite transporter (DMT)-like permease